MIINTKRFVTPYITREPETIECTQLDWVDLAGLSQKESIRIRTASGIRVLLLKWIDTIDGKSIAPAQSEWEVMGSSGKRYTVDFHGGKWGCTCPHYTYRKKECKHIMEIKAQAR